MLGKRFASLRLLISRLRNVGAVDDGEHVEKCFKGFSHVSCAERVSVHCSSRKHSLRKPLCNGDFKL